MKNKYSWFSNHEEKLGYTIIHTEDEVETIIAVTDTAEKAHFLSKAANQFDLERYESEVEKIKAPDWITDHNKSFQ